MVARRGGAAAVVADALAGRRTRGGGVRKRCWSLWVLLRAVATMAACSRCKFSLTMTRFQEMREVRVATWHDLVEWSLTGRRGAT
ncbi:hypothetical protein DEO72_LG5g1807 [Vigna unguiculata]|uniref:Uncharacterized protein n=1 Tax=Vigna unguiculata TaxID=3917 RepID=A0A4D6LZE8_VIGUN|nr:hypothetical protein DEO72_LG5g1807 [Vigna unguiculata]